ncbi:MAG: hypothetical protein WBZ20_12365 [Nitrososphaeraceae archaeon]
MAKKPTRFLPWTGKLLRQPVVARALFKERLSESKDTVAALFVFYNICHLLNKA